MGRFAGFSFLAVLFAACAGSAQVQLPPAPGSEPASPFQISVNLNLVVLPVSVRDRKGGFASDLQQQDFEVFEDNVKQQLRLFRHDDVPVTVGLVVDHSGSMQSKINDVIAAAKAFVQMSNPEDQMFVVNFNEHVTQGLPDATPFTDKPELMEAAIERAPLTGQTALYDALETALAKLKTGNRDKKVLIVISDGGDNASKITLPQIMKDAVESNAIVYTMGIYDKDDPDQNVGVLKRLAKETGGDAYFPAEFSEAVTVCQEIAKDIRHQYTLGFVSNSNKPAGHRALRVVARAAGKDLMVRTRSGYVAEDSAAAKEAVK